MEAHLKCITLTAAAGTAVAGGLQGGGVGGACRGSVIGRSGGAGGEEMVGDRQEQMMGEVVGRQVEWRQDMEGSEDVKQPVPLSPPQLSPCYLSLTSLTHHECLPWQLPPTASACPHMPPVMGRVGVPRHPKKLMSTSVLGQSILLPPTMPLMSN